jgi:hypothetical protein
MDNPEFLVQSFGKASGELRAPIRHNLGWESVEAEYLAVVDIRYPFRIDLRSGRQNVYLFTIMVNINYNSIVPFD